MLHSFLLRPFLPLLIILLSCAPIHAFSSRWFTSDNSNFKPARDSTQFESAPAQRQVAVEQQSYSLRNVFPQLTWLRDTAIEKVFGLPPKTSNSCTNKPSCLSPKSSSQLPATLLAKYGGDVVLRFNLSTPHEEQALAEAADTLFLDVWGFTNNWADVRLREDDVR